MIGDPDYGFGTRTEEVLDACTWHGPLGSADHAKDEPRCPVCKGPLMVISEAGFWAVVNRNTSEYIGMMHWSQGRCFPDYDAQMGAYRQYLEGRR